MAIRAAAVKILRNVEIDALRSNQHEFNGAVALKRILGNESRDIRAGIYYVGHDGAISHYVGGLKWYDARKRSAERTGRSEYRFYYSAGLAPIITRAQEGDTLLLTVDDQGNTRVIILAQGVAFITVLLQALEGPLSPGEYSFLRDFTQMDRLTNMLGN